MAGGGSIQGLVGDSRREPSGEKWCSSSCIQAEMAQSRRPYDLQCQLTLPRLEAVPQGWKNTAHADVILSAAAPHALLSQGPTPGALPAPRRRDRGQLDARVQCDAL